MMGLHRPQMMAALAMLAMGLCSHACHVGKSDAPRAGERPSSAPITNLPEMVAAHIRGLELERARAWLATDRIKGTTAERLRAELALYWGDCDKAAIWWLSQGTEGSPNEPESAQVARACAKAWAGTSPIEDRARGVWVRFQDSRDQALFQLISDTALGAHRQVSAELGVALEKPLRIDVVSDLFSLSAVTGLPLSAAETTGTVAVARWGRVTMLSPRATPEGYPWQDTLAHEIAHLLVTRASADAAPLWLQEGIAKREETRWRRPRPFDERSDPRRIAGRALMAGNAVGLTSIGPSVAMLPSPEAALVAYAEAQDFLDFFLRHQSLLGLRLLLFELGHLGASRLDEALIGTSGYTLSEWIRRWQSDLAAAIAAEPEADGADPTVFGNVVQDAPWLDAVARARTGELLHSNRYFEQAGTVLDSVLLQVPEQPSFRWRAAHAHLLLGDLEGSCRSLGPPETLERPQGNWLAILGRVRAASGRQPDAEQAFTDSLAFAPTLERVACRGLDRSELAPGNGPVQPPPQSPWGDLCRAARASADEVAQSVQSGVDTARAIDPGKAVDLP